MLADWEILWFVVDNLSEVALEDRTDYALCAGKATWRRTIIPSGFSAMSNSLAIANKFARFTDRSLAAC